MTELHQNLINGEWVGSEGKENINPSNTNEVVGVYAQASVQETQDAIAAAKAAFPAWSRSGLMDRWGVLSKTAHEIFARKQELGELLSREEGKTLAEGIGEVTRAGQVFEFFAGEALRLAGEILPSVRPGVSVEITREGVGVVGIITPWNFPIAIPAWKIAPAICYGNTIVFKPADLVPGSSWAIVDILHRAGLPKGVLNLVMGRGSTVGPDDARFQGPQRHHLHRLGGDGPEGRCVVDQVQPQVPARNGRQEPDHRARRRRPQSGGGIDGAERVLLNRPALHGLVAPHRHRGHPRCKFVEALTERVRNLRVGDALAKDTEIGPVVDAGPAQAGHRLHRHRQVRRREAARRCGDLVNRDRTIRATSCSRRCSPTATNQMRISREEIFGPVAAVIRVKDYEEALAVANDTEFGLSAGIVTTSLKYATHFKRNAEAGMVMVNVPTAGVDFHVPFGGRKGSSYGPREQGKYASEFFTVVKTAYTAAG
jgi:acyl-CoA reductase-like NAD-dependent aldehyde dehydrogenase